MLIAGTVYSQPIKSPGADLKTALKVDVNKSYSFKQELKGYGDHKEFRLNPSRSSIVFREERNSGWFLIDIPFKGILTFDITPHDLNNDYDWMIFKASADLEKLIQSDRAHPVRSNNARNNKSSQSKTGLNKNSAAAYVKPGPGQNYSSPLQVNAGERLYLIVDNIYGGKGFDLKIDLKQYFSDKMVSLEGAVKDKYSLKNLPAEVIVEDDSTGALIAKVYSDSITGKYRLQVPSNRPLNATAYHPRYLFASQEVFIKQNTVLNFELDTLASDKKLVLFNIHFLPNKDEILTSSTPELERLTKFLSTNPKWNIKIIGHTNLNVFASARYLQKLSFDRAVAVKKYLLGHAISSRRISCSGLGGREPLIVTKDPEEGMKNLRVEIIFVK
ncbi:OmpA family protein [Daejeonella oryzae]|uniref:OmpA family protein n=1 Tax=Daejeonella oryzae TaxID=1122943 RepID=UPI0004146726|nr:OmpA family protein [Daejeonella oryzae]